MKSILYTSIKRGKMMRTIFGTVLTALALANTSYANTKIPTTSYAEKGRFELSGKVTDNTGQPLPGVSVKIKGSTISTTTDVNGQYKLSFPDANAIVVFSFIGFETQEVAVDNKTIINVKLKDASNLLSDVVVLGYTQQKKANVTGAVEQITSKTFENRAVTNIGLALQGASPGLVVTRSSPRPGNEGLAFKIRGDISANGGSPLIVIDGVPVPREVEVITFQNLNPDDIESISILKDGEGAIYGARSANGVLLVTTKKGKGKLKIDYSNNLRFTTTGITAFSPNMQQYATMWLEANKEEAQPNYWVWANKDNLLKMQQGVEGAYPLFGTDFYIFNANRTDEMFARRYSYQHNLSLAGRNEQSGYRLSFGYADNQGNLATAYDGQKQYNGRLSYDYKLTKKLKVETNVSLIGTRTSTPAVGLDETLFGFDMPFYPAKNPYGQWFPIFNGIDGGARRNPAATTSDGGRNNNNTTVTRADLKATYNIFKDLTFEGTAAIQNRRSNQERYVVPVPLYNWYGKQTGTGLYTDGNDNTYSTSAGTFLSQYYSGMFRYNKTINGVHNISATAGINAEKNNSQSISAQRLGFSDLGVYDIDRGAITLQTNKGGKGVNGMYSYIARADYNYKEKYLVSVMGRRDGNSRFAEGFKFKNFGSASLGWIFTREEFLKDIAPILSFGKIRASYGNTGNDAGLDEFEYVSRVSTGSSVLGSPVAQQNSSSLINNGLISKYRTWERVEKKNLGIDLTFLKNRLSTSFDYFINDNIGMLSQVVFPSVLGGTAPRTNSGHFNAKGWELVVGWKDSKKDFSYNFSFNMADTRNRVSNVEGKDNYIAGKNGIVNGYVWKPWFVYQTDGYFKDQADVDAYYAQYGNSPALAGLPQGNSSVALRPGDTKRLPGNASLITQDGGTASSLVYKGDGSPHYTFGFNSGFSWKGIDLTAFFQGQFEQLIMRNGWMAYPFSAIYTNQNPTFLGQTWTVDNPDAIYPRLTVNTVRSAWNYANNDFMLQNNQYVRLKTLIIGYTLPQSVSRRLGLSRVRGYFSGNDVWEWTSIKDGYDPEAGETSQNAGYPFARTWSFGLNIGL